MHAFANYKACVLLCCLMCLSPSAVQADCCSAQIKKVETTLQGNNYQLSTDILYQFSKKALEALQNGVPLFWVLHIKIQQHRDFLWDKTLFETSIRYRLQYHALLNMYRVRNETRGEVHNFSTLSAALELMSALRDFQLIDKADIPAGQPAKVALKVDFDRNALPLPLRPVAYLNRQWDLSSEWTVWPLKK